MKALILPANPDLETEAESVSTWHIEDWRSLQRREHGPIMTCGGFPWYAVVLALHILCWNVFYICLLCNSQEDTFLSPRKWRRTRFVLLGAGVWRREATGGLVCLRAVRAGTMELK